MICAFEYEIECTKNFIKDYSKVGIDVQKADRKFKETNNYSANSTTYLTIDRREKETGSQSTDGQIPDILKSTDWLKFHDTLTHRVTQNVLLCET